MTKPEKILTKNKTMHKNTIKVTFFKQFCVAFQDRYKMIKSREMNESSEHNISSTVRISGKKERYLCRRMVKNSNKSITIGKTGLKYN